jgi:AAA+ superfamily predicted ATPase
MDAGEPDRPYGSGREHLADELLWLNLLLVDAVVRFRAARHQPPDGYQGIYIADAQVDRLLAEALSGTAIPPGPGQPALAAESLARVTAQRAGIDRRLAVTPAGGLPLQRLAERLGLSAFDRAALLVAAAPDLDGRYEVLYAYLHDDITRRRPTAGLVCSLLCEPQGRWDCRHRLAPDAPLRRYGLVHVDPEPPYLSRALRVDDRVLDELAEVPPAAGLDGLTLRPSAGARLDQLHVPPQLRRRLDVLVTAWSSPAARGSPPVAAFEGLHGTEREAAAAALAAALGRALLELRLARLLSARPGWLTTLVREAVLRDTLLLVTGGELLAGDEPPARELRHTLEPLLSEPVVPSVVCCEAASQLRRYLPGVRLLTVRFPMPAAAERLALWRRAAAGHGLAAADADLAEVANDFMLTPDQIRDAVAMAGHLAASRGPAGPDELREAARAQCRHGLSALARRIDPRFTWDDIVLPEATRRQLQEIAVALRQRHLVRDRWGFGRRLARGEGLNVLFSGPSGTGKTMAAEVLAHQLGLDLYAIDLATVVSKYIGETEKNLKRIFEEARTSNAILFFDEADALFGKRSEVRDSHDRYANIEIAYLLQLMEQYEGMAILATNLSENVDEGFTRRMHHVVDFPFPDEQARARIWRQVFPDEAPVTGDVDHAGLAGRFELTGGHIKGAALAAANLAAGDGGEITMAHIALGVAREYQKLGRLPSRREFGDHYDAVLAHLGGPS